LGIKLRDLSGTFILENISTRPEGMKILVLVQTTLMPTFTPHVDIAKSKRLSRVPIIKADMGSDWCFCLEDGVLTYMALFQPVFGFGAPVWYPLRMSLKHPVAPLQVVQNACLHAITGFHASTSIQHLHYKCRMLQVQDHLDMQCSQFLLNTHQVDHPSHSITSRPPGLRPSGKSTLQHQFNKDRNAPGSKSTIHLRKHPFSLEYLS
jgi:hypothetical protein